MSKLSKLGNVLNGRTIPKKHGQYPAYGGNGIIEYVDTFNYPENTIIIGRVGANCGAIYYSPTKCWVTDNALAFVVKNNNPYFVYCLLKLLNLNQFHIGSSQPLITQSIINNIDIDYIEDIKIQTEIANLLRTIDNKILNNTKIISELESMAKTIYDYWFLQYEFPNEEGKPYKSSGGKMVFNEELKKEIPEGWTIKRIDDIEDNIVTGKTPSTKDENNFGGDIPFITIDDIRQGLYISKTIRTLSEKGANLQAKKYIPENSICVTCIATVGLVGITTQESQTNQQINSIVCENKNNLYYLVNAIKDHFKYSSGAKTGNVFDNMNKEDFSSIKVVHPTENVLKMYKDKMQPLYDNIKSNILENQELTKLRDYLLPLLMNGQVSFKN